MLWVLMWVDRREFGRPRIRVFVCVFGSVGDRVRAHEFVLEAQKRFGLVLMVCSLEPLGGPGETGETSQGRRPGLLDFGVGESRCGTAHYLGYCVVFVAARLGEHY